MEFLLGGSSSSSIDYLFALGPSAACRITYEGNKGNVSLVTDGI